MLFVVAFGKSDVAELSLASIIYEIFSDKVMPLPSVAPMSWVERHTFWLKIMGQLKAPVHRLQFGGEFSKPFAN